MGGIARARYAVQPEESRGRLYPEPASRTRTPFQRDRDRIVHSTAFRRLKHKTQVFVADEGDHFRTRLTHTIEVSQIARAFARALRLDEDLTEAIALVHDFGHTPFGHAGERAARPARWRTYGGFDHNAQSLRIVTALERRYAEFDGLNLTWETLEGLVKHNGPLVGPHAGGTELPAPIADFDALFPLDLDSHASLEAQAAAISDDIAYNTHDLDDGLRAGLIRLEDLRDLGLAGDILREVRGGLSAISTRRAPATRSCAGTSRAWSRTSSPRRSPTWTRSRRRAPATSARPGVRSSCSRRRCGGPSTQTRAFLFERVYRAESVMRVMRAAEATVGALFDRLLERPDLMPGDWHRDVGQLSEAKRARRVCDYLSGMTDTYALAEHRRLFDATPQVR